MRIIVLVVVVLLAGIGWWFSPWSPREPETPTVTAVPTRPAAAPSSASRPVAPPIAGATNPLCPPPQQVATGADPLQTPVPQGFPSVDIEDASLTPLAGISIDARVLSRRDYALGREAKYVPTDLALGWGRMREDAVLDRLVIEQRGRWYHYTWPDRSPPIPSREIAKSSANMHIIPADDAVSTALSRVEAGQRIRVDGWLVELKGKDGWRWRSSTTRDDQGGDACELIYTCSITTL